MATSKAKIAQQQQQQNGGLFSSVAAPQVREDAVVAEEGEHDGLTLRELIQRDGVTYEWVPRGFLSSFFNHLILRKRRHIELYKLFIHLIQFFFG